MQQFLLQMAYWSDLKLEQSWSHAPKLKVSIHELQLESTSLKKKVKIKQWSQYMQSSILQMGKWSNATLNRDLWRDLLMIDHFEAIKHGLVFLWLIWLLYSLYYSYIKVLVDAAVHSEHEKIIKWDFKPGSVERSKRFIPKRVRPQ
jgi:hypothetical protein